VNLAVFDVDGTLVRTVDLDDRLYLRACTEAFGVRGVDGDWTRYRESTDSGIAAEIHERHLGRPASPADLARQRRVFARLWEEALRGGDRTCREVAGASAFLGTLRRLGWRVAIATGGWRVTALHKLRAARIPLRGLPAAFADDAPRRSLIIRIAIERAQQDAPERIDRVVYLGDAAWDVHAARELLIGFVGVAEEGDGRPLREAGAARLVRDYTDPAAVIRTLEEAASGAGTA
jgi:phosphoglycolate phosphatase-like HAD superfamily hydrolase